MKVVIIGSGNVATVMGGKIAAAGHTILQVVARRPEAAAALGREWGAEAVTEWAAVRRDADLYILSISDRAITELSGVLQLPDRLVVHTAGAVPLRALAGISMRCGVLYPLQSMRKEIRPFPEFPLLIDACDPEDLILLETFARSIAPQVQRADDAYRLKCHVAAVLVNNFGNFLFVLARDFCDREHIDFGLLQPIIGETAARLEHYPPRQVQTGPAIRGDAATMQRHLELLAGYPRIKTFYELFSAQIAAYFRN
ncbi:MAG TPA: DUF2520 domain-containing protein [Puia sp.]|nr:DUF2520 domain-containing protein [Puia sp.]